MWDWSRQRVVVTGAAGFIGTNLVDALLNAQVEDVTGIDAVADHRPQRQNYRFFHNDVRDRSVLDEVISDVDPTVVFHLAARTDLQGATASDYEGTTHGTEALLASIGRLSEPPRLVVTSSRLVVPTGTIPSHDEEYAPDTVYGASKVEQERIVRNKTPDGIPWTIVRPTSIWGPHFGVPYRGFFNAVGRGWYVHPRGVRIVKSMGYVENTVAQLLGIATQANGKGYGRTLHLCDYEPLEVFNWAQLIANEMQARVREVPGPLLRTAAAGGDVLARLGVANPPLTSFRLKNLTTPMTYATDDLEDLAGPVPYDLAEGVKRTVSWLAGRSELSRV